MIQKTDITTAEGGAGLATAEWGEKDSAKKLQAKEIIAKTCNNESRSKKKASDDTTENNDNPSNGTKDSFSQDIEWIEAIGQVQVTFPGKIMTADMCKSQGQKIKCVGNVIIISGKNSVKGDNGSFDIENDRYEISTNPETEQQVEATLYSEKSTVSG